MNKLHRVWKCTTPDPDITLTARTLSVLIDRAWRYYGICLGMRRDVLSDIRKYGYSGRTVLHVWREYEVRSRV